MYKILICDDERDIRNALRIYLTGEGYAVCEADSGLAALELMQREEVQLVLMDIMMPGMDGMTATAKLREQSNVPHRQERGQRQDPRSHCRRGRLYHQALQSS